MTVTEKTLLVIQLSSGAFDTAAALAPFPQDWRVVPVAADVDAVSGGVLSPMDLMGPAETDTVYAAARNWQEAMPGIRLSDGMALHDYRPWSDAPPVVWAWLNRLYPYVHLHIRLIELLYAATGTVKPEAWAVVGHDPSFPWRRTLVERCLRTFLPGVEEISLGPSQAPQPAEPEDASLRRDRPSPRRRLTPLKIGRWLWRRLRRPAPVQSDPALQLPSEAVFDPADVVLVMRGKRGSQWHFCPVRGAWGVRDEYIENVPEALIDACRAAGRRLTIIYHGDPPDYDDVRRSYADRYPGVVQEIATGPLAELFRAHRRAVAKRLPAGFLDGFLTDPAFAAGFQHREVAFWDDLRPHAEVYIPNLILTALAQYEAWKLLFSAIGPATVVGGRMEAVPAMTTAAHAVGARVVSVKLGVGQEMLPSVLARQPDGTYADACFPDALAVWGEPQVAFLRRHIPAYRGRIVAVGRGRNDTFAADTQPRASVRAALGIPPDARLIVYAATARTHYGRWPAGRVGASCLSLEEYARGLHALAGLADGETWLLVKPHAADDLEAIAGVVESCGREQVRLLRPGGPIHNADLLGASDVLVSSLSSIFAEAVLLDCPAVNLWLPEVNFLYEEERCRLYGRIAATVEEIEVMVATVRLLLEDPEARHQELARARQALSGIIGPVDGGNAARIAALVLAGEDGPAT